MCFWNEKDGKSNFYNFFKRLYNYSRDLKPDSQDELPKDDLEKIQLRSNKFSGKDLNQAPKIQALKTSTSDLNNNLEPEGIKKPADTSVAIDYLSPNQTIKNNPSILSPSSNENGEHKIMIDGKNFIIKDPKDTED